MDSREAEGLVRISIHRTLTRKEHGFENADRKYQGFWRRAEADGCAGAETGR